MGMILDLVGVAMVTRECSAAMENMEGTGESVGGEGA